MKKVNKKFVVILSILIVILISIGIYLSTHLEEKKSLQSSEIYYCPMHPEVTSNKPSVCPICNMNLVKKSDEAHEHETTSLTLSDSKLVLANVKTWAVKTAPLEKEIKLYTFLEIPESNRKIISARFSGRIEKLYLNETGKFIKKGDVLFEIYSPQLIQAQNDLLSSLNIPDGENKELISSSVKKLKLFGITDEQIERIMSTKQLFYTMEYYAPFSGFVLQKNVSEGQYTNEGMMLYEIVDISTLWAVSEIYETDIKNIKVGDIVKIKIDAYPNEQFSGIVSFISPIVNSTTRTVQIRSVVKNLFHKLKPYMYGSAYIQKKLGFGILIPSSAVLMKGESNIVWVKVGENSFEPRLIEIGEKFNDYYLVLSGLKEGDEIVVSGAYLIDSESQLKNFLLNVNHFKENFAKYDKKDTVFLVKDKSVVPFNSVCPVLGEEVDLNGPKVFYNGKVYGFCCKGCDEKFMRNPEYYAKRISVDGQKFLGE